MAARPPASKPKVATPPAPKLSPEDTLLEKAKRARDTGDEAQAEQLLERMIVEFPQDPRGRVFLGNMRRRRGDEAGALDEYQKALKKSPNEPLALWYKADLYLSQKEPDFAQAVAAYKKIVTAQGRKKDEASRKYVDGAKERLRFCEARKLSLQSRRFLTDPTDTKAVRKGRDLLEKALAVYPEDARNHMNLGVAHLLLGDVARAASLCQAAIALNARYARAHLMLGRALRRLGRLNLAREAFHKCFELDRSGKDANEAWHERKQVDVEIAQVRQDLHVALGRRARPAGPSSEVLGARTPDQVPLGPDLNHLKQIAAMLEVEPIEGADVALDPRGFYVLTIFVGRQRVRFYPGPESLVREVTGPAG